MYITRLASNEIFSPSNKIHREVGRAKELSTDLTSNNWIFRLGINGLFQTFLSINNHHSFFCSNLFIQLQVHNRQEVYFLGDKPIFVLLVTCQTHEATLQVYLTGCHNIHTLFHGISFKSILYSCSKPKYNLLYRNDAVYISYIVLQFDAQLLVSLQRVPHTERTR